MVGTTLTPPTTQIRAAETGLLQRAFAVRRANFPDEIKFFAPGLKRYATDELEQNNPRAFQSVSITGSACALDCDHCNKKILEPMIPLNPRTGLFNLCKHLASNGTESVLISGGSKSTGETPFMKHTADIRRVKDELGMRIIVHTGLVLKNKEAAALKSAGVDGIALDIIGADETIREVYHLDATTKDYDRSLALLSGHGLSLRPHIIIGLHYGQILGEHYALEMIARHPIHSVVLVILVPMHDTKMWGVKPPDTSEVADFFAHSRIEMPQTPVLLGCARPLGDYKSTVDKAAVEAGLNGIAFPAEGIVAHSAGMGLKPVYYENACSCGT